MAKLSHKPLVAHPTQSPNKLYGTVMAAHGRHYLIEANEAAPAEAALIIPPQRPPLLNCVTRGKRSDVAVGDVVEYQLTSKNQGVIDAITERKTLLYRSDQYRSKLLAANLTQLFIVVATEPAFSDDLICRALIAAEAGGITPHLIFNKIDVIAPLAKARQRLELYQGLGYPVHAVSAKAEPQHTLDTLLPLLQDQSTILIGQSGMGKSSLINLLIPDADIAVREISAALDTGKHTTTFVRSYHLNPTSIIIDSPGFQEFGLHHLSEGMLERALPEFRPHLGNCKFYNCHHHTEPGCAILSAMQQGSISKMRHGMYEQLVHEAAQTLGYK
jgi:ribosome biogenesis GTPase